MKFKLRAKRPKLRVKKAQKVKLKTAGIKFIPYNPATVRVLKLKSLPSPGSIPPIKRVSILKDVNNIFGNADSFGQKTAEFMEKNFKMSHSDFMTWWYKMSI